MSVDLINFGCRLNLAEGASIARALDGGPAQTVINSCAVTGEAVRQARQAVRRAARARPGIPVVVTGCAAATDRAAFTAMPEVSRVIPTMFLREARPAVSGDGHSRAFVEIQNGCDHDCTFCVTTLARGSARSLAIGEIVEVVAEAVAGGQREVVLTGVDLTSYRPSLATLITAILSEVPRLSRLRLSSLDPAEVDAPLFNLLTTEPRVMPHVHLSLQSGDAMILKRMKRRHTPGQAVELTERLRQARPEIAIGADFIAGFPTETDAMHAATLANIAASGIVFAHVFPYSPRPGTAAARMPQVLPAVARQRAAELRSIVAVRHERWLDALTGAQLSVLVERDGQRGRAANFAPVVLSAHHAPGTVADVRITGRAGDRLAGVAI